MFRMLSTTALIALCAGAAAAEPVPIEEFAKAPALNSLSMSSEGDFIVGLVAMPGTDNQETALAVWDIDGSIDVSKPLLPSRITPAGKMDFIGATAMSGGRLRVRAKQTWTGATRCIEGGGAGSVKTVIRKEFFGDKSINPKKLTDKFAGLGNSDAGGECPANYSIVSQLPLEPDYVIARTRTADGAGDYYKVNMKTEKKEFLFRDAGEVRVGYMNPRDGKPLSKQELQPIVGNDYEIRTYLLNAETGNFDLEEPLTYKARARETLTVEGRDEASGKFYITTDKFTDKAAVYLYDAKTNEFSKEPLFAHPDFDAVDVVLGTKPHNFNKVLGFRYAGAAVETFWIDPEYKSIDDGLKAAFPGKLISYAGTNGDLSRVLFMTESSDSPPAYYLLIDKSKVAVIGSSRPWMSNYKLGKTDLVYYTARDGLSIPALLTPAAGWKQGDSPRPAIVLPHGGPWARDFADYDSSGWVQFFATRGYHVIQPQYRGSSGWGKTIWFAGDNQWGMAMQDDKDDAAAWLVSEGYAKQDAIAIMGYSYGGFAAFAATVRSPSPFQCAIAGAGVSNLALFRTNVSSDRVSRAVQGHTMTGMDPLDNANKAVLPILVFHGERDVRVPIKDGRDFYNAVKGRVPAKFLELKDMGHQGDLWTLDNTRQSFKAMEDFIRNDCGPGGL